ncbi:MAG: lipoyl(octanoyl) transferase LipB [SAR202 cluster bacterium]|nr:lipoyl(octanoyl) transferase LipB [SAR202 cluster bacterium]MQG61793.1 lipoyl(octanoyl) transferase LipB [SAR202 cluster bacterium]MQG64354.1 lipoyl(octanoyl) transferase LipB [SAR202 cluster bacterium]|tara:strand:+ start:1178 stop:1843 length:666 start_codon:yes stop_codon:yes gene_type:complete
MPLANLCRAVWLGDLDYQKAYDLQLSLVEKVLSGQEPNTLLMLEHPHVYTKGRLSKDSDVLLTEEELAAKGIPVYETDRGGQVTYHGPGQLVVYPIVNLKDWGGPVKYVRALEQVVIATLTEMGITANRESGNTGVWTSQGKLSAIGVKISRGIAFHGFALNVNTDLAYYQNIIPCGIADRPVTSMASILGQPVDIELVRYGMVYQFGREFGWRMEDGVLA